MSEASQESWENIKAELKVTVTANDVLVAETKDPVLWAEILRRIGDYK